MSCRVTTALDVFLVRREARRIATLVGLSRIGQAEVAIVASELASNIVKYGQSGTIEIAPVDGAGGVEMTAIDTGPPITDLEIALRDGHDDSGPIDPRQLFGRGGIGAGLGAVRRLSDEFSYRRTDNQNCIVVRRYASKRSRGV